jgi:hypothetical protein
MNSHRNSIIFCCAALLSGCRPDPATIKRECTTVAQLPLIKPDYTGITIPPGIAPLNFVLVDSSAACIAEITSVNGSSITAWGKKGAVRIPEARWKRLLAQNTGKPLRITLYAGGNRGAWRRYSAIEDTIAAEPVDQYCTYRLLSFQYNYSSDLRECQRDLTSFNETVLVNTQNYAWGCVNCHTPMNNDPNRFVLQSRSNAYGSETLIADSGAITTLSSRLGYTAWHPAGRRIAFSVYKVEQYFHAVGRQFIDVCDNNSCIVIYDAVRRAIVPAPQLNRQGVLDTWPAWSPDGRYLYFCSAPVSPGYSNTEPPENFDKVRYSLLRIAYDTDHDAWGAIDTVLTPRETGLSIAQPKLSPDNRFCLFCMQNYGAYPHSQASSDLYLMDIATRRYRKLPINSEYNESWHSWSKNGRWVLFSSKRGGGIFTRLYFSYIDSTGTARKPFLLPQRDPAFYDSFIKCYNVPEFAVAPVRFSERQLLKAIRARNKIVVPVPENATPQSSNAPPAWEAPPGNRQ